MPGRTNSTIDPDRLLEEAGFDLRQVTWGYQEIFRDIIAELCATGLLGPRNRHVTQAFFEVLKQSDKATIDSVLKGFLEALKGQYRWMMRLPRLFERWCKTGMELAQHRHFQAIKFFELASAGELGTTPAEAEFVLDMVGFLLKREPELVGAFLQGYSTLSASLDSDRIRDFVSDALRIFARNPRTGRSYLAIELDSAQRQIQRMTRQASLTRRKDALERLAQGLLGRQIQVSNLADLDADDLQMRGCVFVACPAGIYMPEQVAEFATRRLNEGAMKALVSIACACQLSDSVTSVHGAPGIETCMDLAPADAPDRLAVAELLYLVELVRVRRFCEQRLPGTRRWWRRFSQMEFKAHAPTDAASIAMATLMGVYDGETPPGLERVLDWVGAAATRSSGLRDTLECLRESGDVTAWWTAIARPGPMPRPLFFFPDPFFPVTITDAPGNMLKADLHDAHDAPEQPDEDAESGEQEQAADPESAAEEETRGDGQSNDDSSGSPIAVGYFYDEWNVHCGDYYRDWCCIRERRPTAPKTEPVLSSALSSYADQVRRVFERLKSQDVHEQCRLLEGDTIHLDDFIHYVSQRHTKRDTEMRFYCKPLVKKRDVAVAVLLDLSGSTGERCQATTQQKHPARRAARLPEFSGESNERTVLEIEKEAALVLATGLQALGDTFGVFGFTGTGREQCLMYLIKDFDDTWDTRTVRGLLGTTPGSSTRIGVALRHAGWKLNQRPARTKLLLLITDGKPCDQGYDTANHYAQHDVHKACRENMQQGIHTFCVSTTENTPADLELMFPGKRYLILESIARLPAALSNLYLQLTR